MPFPIVQSKTNDYRAHLGNVSRQSLLNALTANTLEEAFNARNTWQKFTDFFGPLGTHHKDHIRCLYGILHSEDSATFEKKIAQLAQLVPEEYRLNFIRDFKFETCHGAGRTLVRLSLSKSHIAQLAFEGEWEPNDNVFVKQQHVQQRSGHHYQLTQDIPLLQQIANSVDSETKEEKRISNAFAKEIGYRSAVYYLITEYTPNTESEKEWIKELENLYKTTQLSSSGVNGVRNSIKRIRKNCPTTKRYFINFLDTNLNKFQESSDLKLFKYCQFYALEYRYKSTNPAGCTLSQSALSSEKKADTLYLLQSTKEESHYLLKTVEQSFTIKLPENNSSLYGAKINQKQKTTAILINQDGSPSPALRRLTNELVVDQAIEEQFLHEGLQEVPSDLEYLHYNP